MSQERPPAARQGSGPRRWVADARARLREDESWRAAAILLVSATTCSAWYYFGAAEFYQQRWQGLPPGTPVRAAAAGYEMGAALVLLGLVPLLVGWALLGLQPRDLGLQLGRWRQCLLVFAVLAPFIVGISWNSAASPQIAAEYPINGDAGESIGAFLRHVAMQFAFYLGWELHFRGFLQFGVAPRMGREASCGVQVLASCLAHFGKPPLETFASILGGVWWGVHAFRCRTILGGLLQHWLLGASLDYFLAFG